MVDRLVAPGKTDPDELYDAFTTWVEAQGLALYPHQDEAVIELLGGSNVILATPTGSGKSLVAVAAHFAAAAGDRVSFYTAPIKALVSEKFFALCEVFGPDDVGMLTGDAAVNPDAPDHLLHRRGAGQHRPARGPVGGRRTGGDGRVPLLLRAGPRLGLAGPDPGAAAGAVPADVRHARRRQPVRRRPHRPHRPRDRPGRRRRAPGAPDLLVGGDPPRGDGRGAGQHASGAGVRRALHAGGRGRAGELAADAQGGDPGGEGRDRGGDRRLPVRRRLRQDAVQAGAQRDRRPPRRDAAALPPPGRAAGPGRAAQGHLRHRHPRRRHQRADPDGAVHRAGEVRRQPVPGAADPGVPADRRPRGPRRLRHRGLRRRPGARARHRQREGQGEVRGQERRDERREAGEEEVQAAAPQAARGHRRLVRADLREARRRGARAAGVPDEDRQRDAAQPGRPRGGRLRRRPGG